MNTNFRNLFYTLIAFAITLSACGAPRPPVEATETPAAPPAPERFNGASYSAAAAAVKSCESMPVWLLHPDWRGLNARVAMTSPDYAKSFTGQVAVMYVAYGQVFINDRLVEFAPDGVEVFQIFEDKTTFELDPGPYIGRATEILKGDVQPVEINATWKWLKDESGEYEYDYWSWEVTSVSCSRLDAVVLRPTREPHRPD